MRLSRGELRRRRLVTPDLFLLFLELADEAFFVDCAMAAGVSAAKPAHKIRSASTPTDCQRLRTTLCLLSPKIGAHNGTVVFGQAAYQFVIEVIAARGRSIAITLPIGRTALLDVVLQAVIYIFVFASLGDFGLVVQLDFIHQQAGKTLCLAVNVRLFERHLRKRVCGRRGSGRRCYAYRFGFCNRSRFLGGSWSNMLGSMPGKGIRISRNRLRLRRGLCSFLDRSIRSSFLRRLLA